MESQAEQPPRWAGIQAGPALAGVLYFLLVGSAGLALWSQQRTGVLPPALEAAAPYVFLAFAVVFALYRFILVRAKKYPVFKALFQVAATGVFFMLLLPGARLAYDRGPKEPVVELLQDSNPEVRALAAEVMRHRPNAQHYGPALVKALQDPNPKVREEAHRTLVQLAGQDLGAPEDPNALKAWGAKYP